MNWRLALFVAALPAAAAGLRAGAARVEITPPAGAALPMSGYAGREAGFKSIHDQLYARAIVVDDGARTAAIVIADISAISTPFWEKMSARMAKETGIARECILLAATHTHGGPSLGYLTDDPDTKLTSYTTDFENKLAGVLRQAQANLQPARVGAGTGRANVNSNRTARLANGGYWLGYNPDGPSDKTVAVIKFENPAGKPIAFLINYGVHGTVMGADNFAITGDLPGATSRYVEKQFGNEAVAAWSSGAGGDQNPIYRQGKTFDDVDVLGQILGEEVVRVAAGLRTSTRGAVRAAQKTVTCPGKKMPPGPRRRKDNKYEFLDADPVNIRLSLLQIGHTAIAGVSGEVLTLIGQRLKKESPLTNTMMLTHCNGSSGYIPNDAAYDVMCYETVTARVKKGCAENAIVTGFLEMMEGAL